MKRGREGWVVVVGKVVREEKRAHLPKSPLVLCGSGGSGGGGGGSGSGGGLVSARLLVRSLS